MGELDMSYMAGFIDGEGCIGVVKTHGYSKRKDDTRPYYMVNISATNCVMKPLELLKEYFGGFIYNHHKTSKKDKHCWRWQLRAHKAVVAIESLYPYLRVKKPQAELCLEFAKTVNKNSIIYKHLRGRITGNRVKPSIIKKRELIANKLTELNKRGK